MTIIAFPYKDVRMFYVYILRRIDKYDPFYIWLCQPFYVGKGCNGRISMHRWEAKNLLNSLGEKTIKIKIIHKLWKYDLDFIEEIMFDNLTEAEAFKIEKELIVKYGRMDLGTGCLANLTDGGEGPSGCVVSSETGLKISKAKKGKPLSAEARQNMSMGQKGKIVKPRTEEQKRRMSEAQIGNQNGLGSKHPHTEETKNKISDSKIGRKDSEEARKNKSEAQKLIWKYRRWDSLIKDFLHQKEIENDYCVSV